MLFTPVVIRARVIAVKSPGSWSGCVRVTGPRGPPSPSDRCFGSGCDFATEQAVLAFRVRLVLPMQRSPGTGRVPSCCGFSDVRTGLLFRTPEFVGKGNRVPLSEAACGRRSSSLFPVGGDFRPTSRAASVLTNSDATARVRVDAAVLLQCAPSVRSGDWLPSTRSA